MQDYLRFIAVKTKIENYREFDKTKEETLEALIRYFELSLEEAGEMIERFWDAKEMACLAEEESYIRKRERLLQEKERMIRQYDAMICVLEDAINGFSNERIARKNGMSLTEVEEILEGGYNE